MFRFVLFVGVSWFLGASSCKIPANLRDVVVGGSLDSLSYIADVQRNYAKLKHLCVKKLSFKEGRLVWNMLLVWNPKAVRGVFWFLPHDNENSAFDSAVYSATKYGGGFLSVLDGDSRYNHTQDPNRNFSNSSQRVCKQQLAPSPIYTSVVFGVIDTFKEPNMPYLAIHNNTNGGGISALKSNSKVKSYLAYPKKEVLMANWGLKDADNLVYIAGVNPKPSRYKLQKLLKNGLNVRYEMVNPQNNDCSMSNYVVLEKNTQNYYNIEAQHGQTKTQKRMVDILVNRVIFNR